jgi:UDP-N-acetylmuramate--alanine ligase
VDRRFSYRGTFCDAEIFDDYGHHPIEIMNTLAIARNRSKNKLVVVFQPHRYIRTHKLWDQFIDILSTNTIDNLIITDIYPAGEAPIEGVTSKNMYEALRTRNPEQAITYIPFDKNFTDMPEYLERTLTPNDLLLVLGAGNINKLAQKLVSIE